MCHYSSIQILSNTALEYHCSLCNNVLANNMQRSAVPLLHSINRCGRLMFSKERFQRLLTLNSMTRSVASNGTDS